MRQSAFAKYDNRTGHERFCDYEIEKYNRGLVRCGSRVGRNPQPKGIKTNNYSNLELKNLLEKC